MKYPDDIWVKADEAFDRASRGEMYAQDSIAAAILAERRRCAEVARMFAGYTDSQSGEAHNKEAKRLAEDTAAWIWTEIMEPCQ